MVFVKRLQYIDCADRRQIESHLVLSMLGSCMDHVVLVALNS